MIFLERASHAWGTADFEDVLKQEIASLGPDELPLQQGLSNSSSVVDAPITVVIKDAVEQLGVIRVRARILYLGVIGGCSCADDPSAGNTVDEYCEVQLDIARSTGATMVTLVDDMP